MKKLGYKPFSINNSSPKSKVILSPSLKKSYESPKSQENPIIKPGFQFFESLLKAPKDVLSSLRVNIPDTYYYTDRAYTISTSKSGVITVKENANFSSFLSLLDKSQGIFRIMGEGSSKMTSLILDWAHIDRHNFVNRIQPFSMLQKHMNSNYDRKIIRLFYFPRKAKTNFGYFINKDRGKSLELKKEQHSQIKALKVSGRFLHPFEREADKLVRFLDKVHAVRTSEITLDFVKDQTGTIWLSGCKHIKVDRSRTSKISTKTKTYCLCNMCRLQFPINEMKNLVSVRMLVSFNESVTQRRELSWDFSHIPKDRMSQTHRICDLCYVLINVEIELQKTKDKLGSCFNVPVHKQTKTETMFEHLNDSVYQWRILLHLKALNDIKKLNNLYIHIMYPGSVSSFQLKSKALNIARIFYFFSESKNMKESLDSLVKIRLTIGKSSAKSIKAQGCVKLSSLMLSEHIQALTESKTIYLFGNHKAVGSVNLVAGLSFDKEVKKSKASLVHKSQSVYIPQESFFTSDPLPIAWIEVFEDRSADCLLMKTLSTSSMGMSPVFRNNYLI